MGDNEEEACKLGLGVGEQYYAASVSTRTKNDHDHHDHHDHGKKMKEPLVYLRLDLCRFQLCPEKENDHDHTDHTISLEGNSSSKRNNKIRHDDQEDHVAICGSKKNDNNIINGGGTSRKKLKLNKEQTTFLEGQFKFNTSLNPAQKQELAEQLNLKPRQVEVWFQNRRARMKMKQTEEDHELLKKYCENLVQENTRLRKELQELRLMKVEPCGESRDVRFANNAELSLCPCCKKMSKLETNITN